MSATRLAATLAAGAAAVLLVTGAGRGPARPSDGGGPRVIEAPAAPVPRAAERAARRFLDLYARAYAGDRLSAARLSAVAATPIVAALEQPPEQRLRGGRVASLALAVAGDRVVGRATVQFEGSQLAASLAVAPAGRRWLVSAFEPG